MPAARRWSMALLFAFAGVATVYPQEPPNILFVSIDDLNDWVGFLGGHPQVRTPYMDRLASRGVVFSNAHCAAPRCSPSRAAVLSGKQPFNTGVYDNPDSLEREAPDLTLLPQYFNANGYRTFATGKILHRKRKELFDEAYLPEQRWSPFPKSLVDYTEEELPSKGTDDPRHVVDLGFGTAPIVMPLNRLRSVRSPNDPMADSFDWGAVEFMEGDLGDTKVAEWAGKRLREEHEQPFFLFVGFYRPHVPLYAPRKYFDMYPVETVELPPTLGSDLDDLSDAGRFATLQSQGIDLHAHVQANNRWEEAVAAYLACITYADEQLGRVLNALESGPHAENTVIVLWSDHGFHLGEKRHWGKWTSWERSTRVPLVVVPPRSETSYATGTCRQPVGLIDLFPTLVEMTGIEPHPDLDGVSLVPQLRDVDHRRERPALTTLGPGWQTLRTNRWRWMVYPDGTEELYDLWSDPNEWTNLAGQGEYAGVAAELRQCLEAGHHTGLGVDCAPSPTTGFVALDDAYSVPAGGGATQLPVLRNDGGADSSSVFRIARVSDPSRGKVTITPDGTALLYTPGRLPGETQLQYSVELEGTTHTANVRIRLYFSQMPGAFRASPDGLVVLESESFTGSLSRSGFEWSPALSADFSGSASLQVLPNDGTRWTGSREYVAESPRLDFLVEFERIGLHYVWVRALAPTFQSNSLFVGLDGLESSEESYVSLDPKATFEWYSETSEGGRLAVYVPTVGSHHINLWPREVGIVVDKIIVSPDVGYVPTGQGPAESARVEMPTSVPFVRGDCNGDGRVGGTVSDVVFFLGYQFLGAATPDCLAACDADGDGEVSGQVTDAIFLLSFSFLGGPPPPAPFPRCGAGNAADERRGCEDSPCAR